MEVAPGLSCPGGLRFHDAPPDVVRRALRSPTSGSLASLVTRAPWPEYDEVLAERGGFEQLTIEPADWSRALEVQRELAHRSQLRAVGIADLLLAAVAERHRVTLLHYDRHFDVDASMTGQGMRWGGPRRRCPSRGRHRKHSG